MLSSYGISEDDVRAASLHGQSALDIAMGFADDVMSSGRITEDEVEMFVHQAQAEINRVLGRGI
jgi:hypothetical protein